MVQEVRRSTLGMTETHRAWPTSSRTSSASSAAVGAPHPGESVLEKPAVEVAPDMLVDETAPEVEVGFDTPIQGCRTRTPSPIRRRAGSRHRDARRLLQRWRESLAGSRSRQRSTANARSMARRVGPPLRVPVAGRGRSMGRKKASGVSLEDSETLRRFVTNLGEGSTSRTAKRPPRCPPRPVLHVRHLLKKLRGQSAPT